MNVLIIPDGNRRGARKLGVSYSEVYRIAASKVDMAVKFFLDQEPIERVVVFGCSYDNVLKRPPEEMMPIYEAQRDQYLKWVEDEFLVRKGVGVRFFGELYELELSPLLPSGFPKDYIEATKQLVDLTGHFDWKYLGILVGYSGAKEVNRAIMRILSRFGTMTLDDMKVTGDFAQFLDLPFMIDLVIRTGGERRTSDCLPNQTAYSEFVFIDKFFPELEKSDLQDVLEEYYSRERRFGR